MGFRDEESVVRGLGGCWSRLGLSLAGGSLRGGLEVRGLSGLRV